MSGKKPKVLVVGSHAYSGFSMQNFTVDTFDTLSKNSAQLRLTFKTPKKIASIFVVNSRLRKFGIYIDKYIFFGFYLFLISSRNRFQVVHILDHSDSIYRFYIRKRSKFCITVHDLFAIEAAEGNIPGVSISLLGRIYQKIIRYNLARFHYAFAISEVTEKSVIAKFPHVRTTVVHNFIDDNLSLNNSSRFEKLPNNYFLLLMNSHWRKNRLESIRAWYSLTRDGFFNKFDLVIVGNPLTTEEIKIVGVDSLSNIKCFQNLERSDVRRFYEHCVAVINISKYEGFGMPIIEANKYGKVCIYGGSNAFKEIAGPLNIEWTVGSSRGDIVKHVLESQSVEARKRLIEYAKSNFSLGLYRKELISKYLDSLEC